MFYHNADDDGLLSEHKIPCLTASRQNPLLCGSGRWNVRWPSNYKLSRLFVCHWV